MCLAVKGRSTGPLTLGTSGPLAWGAEAENRRFGGQKSPQNVAQSLCLISPTAQGRIRGQRCPRQAPSAPSPVGRESTVLTGRHHSTQGGGRGWAWARCHPASSLTWAHGGAGSLLEGLALTEGASIEWGGVGTGPCALLPASATAVGAGRPLCPAGPSAIHCENRGCYVVGLALHPMDSQVPPPTLTRPL